MGNNSQIMQAALAKALAPVKRATPTPSDVHINRLMTNLVIANFQSLEGFVANKVFPGVPVDKQANYYPKWDAGQFNLDLMKKRAPATESAGGGIAPTQTLYFAEVYAFHVDMDDQVLANYDVEFRNEQSIARFLAMVDLLRREIDWMETFFTTSVWTTDKDVSVKWNDAASTPIKDILNAKRTVKELTGYAPNILVVGAEVHDALRLHPEVIDRLKYGQTPGGPAQADNSDLAALFNVDQILVADAIKNTANEGQTASHSFIAGKHALLCYSNPGSLILEPTAGVTFEWNGYTGAGVNGSRTSTFRMENIKSDRHEIESAWTQDVICADLGYFFNEVADMSATSLT